MSERDFIGRETNHFAPNALPTVLLKGALFTRGAPAGEYSMPRGKRFVRIVLVHAQQSALAATSNKNHPATRAFALPSFALERGEAVGETLAQVAARR
jgi:hypothetical protein